LTEAEGEAQSKAISDQKEARETALTNRENKAKTQQAKFERMASLFNIGISTAEEVGKIKLKVAEITAAAALNPLLVPSIAIASAMIPAAIGMGALEAAAILASPLPTYARGTKDHKGGPAILGDAFKHELAITPTGQLIKTPNVPTVMNLPKHTKVLPDYTKAMQEMAFNASVSYMNENKPDISLKAYNDAVLNGMVERMLTQGANQLLKLDKLDNLKKLDRLSDQLTGIGETNRILRTLKKNPWVH